MGLNKSKGNMYEDVTHTWNPLAGKCYHGCSYCSTNKFYYPHLIDKYSGELRLQESEMKTNLGKGNFIFVCAQNDLFTETVPHETILRILEHCAKYPDNKYLFQSKDPNGFHGYGVWLAELDIVLCTTIESNRFYSEIMVNSPEPSDRAESMRSLAEARVKTYVTIEPIMDFDLSEMVDLISDCDPVQVNIGADSGNNNLPEPSKEKILELITELETFTKVKQKSNLKRLLK